MLIALILDFDAQKKELKAPFFIGLLRLTRR